MSFDPVARWRNLTIDNVKQVLELYKNVPDGVSRKEGEKIIQQSLKAYTRTAYQIFCQAGLQNRGHEEFVIQKYVLHLDDKDLYRYMTFWFKIYYAPNPYVNSNDEPLIIYKEVAKQILSSAKLAINFKSFFNKYIGGSNYDIIRNIFDMYGEPIKLKGDTLFINIEDTNILKNEISVILKVAPIPHSYNDKNQYFARYNEENFNKFYQELRKINEVKEDLVNNILSDIEDYNENTYNQEEIERENQEQHNVQNGRGKNEEEINKSNNRAPQKLQTNQGGGYVTDPDLKKTVIESSGFKCEYAQLIGEEHITFETKMGNPYMEGHHIIPMAAQKNMEHINLDRTENIISLCPTCHRAVHYGSKKVRESMVNKMYEYRRTSLVNAGIDSSIEEILKYYL